MLQDLRECVQKLDAESFAEIKSYAEPPALVHNIVKAVLLLFHPNWKGSEETENWSQCILVRLQNISTLFSVIPPPRRYSGICQVWIGCEIINYVQISCMLDLAIFSSVTLSSFSPPPDSFCSLHCRNLMTIWFRRFIALIQLLHLCKFKQSCCWTALLVNIINELWDYQTRLSSISGNLQLSAFKVLTSEINFNFTID